MPLTLNGQTIETNEEGFLLDQTSWNEAVAEKLCAAHSVTPTEAHWEIIHLLRNYCTSEGNEPPSMRELVTQVKERLSADKAKSIYLMKLFGASPAKMAARLAGLPKPKNCL